MNFLRDKLGRYWFLIVICIMIALFMTIVTRKDNLTAFKEGDSSKYTVETETEKEVNVDTNTYQNKDINLSMEIPSDWQYVLKDGYDTYIHNASASSIQIQVLSYYPQVNEATQESLTETYSAQGYTLTEFAFTKNCAYYMIYQSQGTDETVDYIEMVLWDRQHVVKVLFTFKDMYYEKLQDELWACLDSINWVQEEPVNEAYFLHYQIKGDFEYAVPMNWTVGNTDGSYYAYDQESGASLIVNLLEDESDISEISQLDYTNFMSSNKTGFVLTGFEQSENRIIGTATYNNNGISTAIYQEYIANGVYHYIITYEFPVENENDLYSMAQEALSYTRVFYIEDNTAETDVPESDSEEGDESEAASNVNTSEAETMTSEEISEEETTHETETSSEETVSSFASALVDVASISQKMANTISDKWNAANCGSPTYAEAVKENEDSLIIYIETNEGTNYYMYISKDGELQSLHINSEDGPEVTIK